MLPDSDTHTDIYIYIDRVFLLAADEELPEAAEEAPEVEEQSAEAEGL